MNFPAEEFKEWFVTHRRKLPWREDPSPYRVWISEVMLQQTQVAVVIPYFERWMEQFPTIEALAKAPIEHVMKAWEGLGYYSRARYLHQAAQVFFHHHGGTIPSDEQALSKIKGLGPYTRGALLSFAFHQKTAAVDGNVVRVLSRYYAVEEEVCQPKVLKTLWNYAEKLLPEHEPWLVSEGLIELGATLCKKREPSCFECPLRTTCLAFRRGLQTVLPKKKKKQATTVLERLVGVIECEGSVLIKKGEEGKVMSGLYEFPYLELQEGVPEREEAAALFSKVLERKVSYVATLSKQEHGFTRYHARLFPVLLSAERQEEKECWKEKTELAALPFSSGHRRILHEFLR